MIRQVCTAATRHAQCGRRCRIFSFHGRPGAKFLFGDGSSRWIKESIKPKAFLVLYTREAGDIVDAKAE